MSARPTVAELTERLDAVESLFRAQQKRTAEAEATAKRTHDDWSKRFDALDPEARALAAIVHAVEQMREKQRGRGYGGEQILYAGSTYPFNPSTGERNPEPPAPPIGATPVGRIILHLAARYGVDLRATP